MCLSLWQEVFEKEILRTWAGADLDQSKRVPQAGLRQMGIRGWKKPTWAPGRLGSEPAVKSACDV